MKFPEKFIQKYHLTGNSYSTANVDAALTELFTLLNKFNKENSSLKAEISRLQEECESRVPAQSSSATSDIEAMIIRLEQKLDVVKSTVNDTLYIVNDAVISAKRAEECAIEAKASADEAVSMSEKACTAAEKACVASENAFAASKAACYSASSIGENVITVGNEIIAKIAENNFSEPIAPIAIENIEEEQEDTVSDQNDDALLVPVFKEESDNDVDAEEDDEDDNQDLDDGGFFSFILEEDVVDPDQIEVIPVDNKEDADAAEDSDEASEETEEIEDEEVKEVDETDEEEQQFDSEESDDIAADLVRAAGLDGEVEQIEPAEDVSEEELTSKLAEMYSSEDETESDEAPTGGEKPEEKPAPTSFNDMKSALDAIRARLKK